MECGSEASAHAEANASALQTGQRAAPLAHFVGEEPGLRATKLLNPRKIPLNFPRIAPSPLDIRAKMCYTIDVIGATPE